MGEQEDLPESAVHVEKVGQIAITTVDLERSKSFYRDRLGMTPLFDAGNMSFFQCGETRFMIGASETAGPPGGTILYFKVANLHSAHAHLAAEGVEFIQEPHLVVKMPDHDLWMAFLKDPDGHVLGLMSEFARA